MLKGVQERSQVSLTMRGVEALYTGRGWCVSHHRQIKSKIRLSQSNRYTFTYSC